MFGKKSQTSPGNEDTVRKTEKAAVEFETCTPCGGTGYLNGELHRRCWGQGEVRK